MTVLRRSGRADQGFTQQQVLLALMILFPVGAVAIGLVVMLLIQLKGQNAVKEGVQPRQPALEQRDPSQRSTTIQPLPPAGQAVDGEAAEGRTSAQPAGLTQEQARSIIEQWLTVKSQIFAPPFNTELADQVVAAGPLWTDLTKPDGSIQWLKNNNSYYTYSVIKVNRVVRYLPSPSMPSIVVSVTETSVLHSPKGREESSGTNDYLYTLKKETGRWKIWDYRKQ